MSNYERYDRQLRVPGHGLDAQQHLRNAQVLLVGAGGLGFAVASLLAGAGVGYLQIVDFDTISITNLHRQWLYTEKELGLPKAEVLAKHLCALNKDIRISSQTVRASPENIQDLVLGMDIIIDAADNFATSYLLSDAAEHHGISLVSASVNQRYGYVGVFSGGEAASFRAVFPKVSNAQTSCDLVGVSGPAVTVLAGLQAQATLDRLTASEHDLTGKVLYVDLLKYAFNLLDCTAANEPNRARIELISSTDIDMQDWVVDVREMDEVESSPQPFRVDQVSPLSSFEVGKIAGSKNARTIVVCKSGQRAMIAGQQLLNDGRDAIAVVLPN